MSEKAHIFGCCKVIVQSIKKIVAPHTGNDK
jgi:hypothetical protein